MSTTTEDAAAGTDTLHAVVDVLLAACDIRLALPENDEPTDVVEIGRFGIVYRKKPVPGFPGPCIDIYANGEMLMRFEYGQREHLSAFEEGPWVAELQALIDAPLFRVDVYSWNPRDLGPGMSRVCSSFELVRLGGGAGRVAPNQAERPARLRFRVAELRVDGKR
jgi:hypothetical protein